MPYRQAITIAELLNPVYPNSPSPRPYKSVTIARLFNPMHLTSPSPCPYEAVMQEARISTPSTRPTMQQRKQRPIYQQEEAEFIWYYRVYLDLSWHRVKEEYSLQFRDFDREGLQGIQGRLYRYLAETGQPKIREAQRGTVHAWVGTGNITDTSTDTDAGTGTGETEASRRARTAHERRRGQGLGISLHGREGEVQRFGTLIVTREGREINGTPWRWCRTRAQARLLAAGCKQEDEHEAGDGWGEAEEVAKWEP